MIWATGQNGRADLDDVMLASLYAIPHEGISCFLEIGCDFGFSVDFAARCLHWSARGIDPGPAARLGRQLLGARIDEEYVTLEGAAPGEANDLILGSELIEHIVDPDAFLTILAANLSPSGTLLLTTRNGLGVHPGASPATLAPLLSPGYHAIRFSPQGLRAALQCAGFDSVVVADWRHTLRAGAARGHCDADFTRPLDRARYRDYLQDVSGRAKPGSALALGCLGRQLKEYVNAGEYEACEPTIAALRAALQAGWRLDLDAPQTMPLDGPLPVMLEDLHRVHPFNLTTILYMMGVRLLASRRFEQAAPFFEAAAKAADRSRTVLRAIGSDDGETEELGWRSRAALVGIGGRRDPLKALAAVESFAGEFAPALKERAPDRLVSELRSDVAGILREAFVSHVGAGNHVKADQLAPYFDTAGVPDGGVGPSSVFAYGILELNHRKSPKRAFQRFSQARGILEFATTGPFPPEAFIWAVRYHEGMAALRSNKRDRGREALGALLDPAPTYGDPDPGFVERARKLPRDCGLIG